MKLGKKSLAIGLAALMLLTTLPAPWVAAQPAQVVDLSLIPAAPTVNAGDTFTVDIVVEPNGQPVVGVDAFVDFDAAHLETIQILAGPDSPFNLELYNQFDNVTGHAGYSAGTLDTPPASGSITLATITFRAKAATVNSSVNFSLSTDRRTEAAYYNAVSVLRNTTGAAVTIAGAQPAAAFIANVTTGPAPLTVSFTDTSTGSPTSWFWEFGDGATSTQRNPTHIYTSAGAYNVALSITVSGATYGFARDAYISILAPTSTPPPATPTPLPTTTPMPSPTPQAGATPTPIPPVVPPISSLTVSVSPLGKVVTSADGKVSVNLANGSITAGGTLSILQYAPHSVPAPPDTYTSASTAFMVTITAVDGNAVTKLARPMTITASYSDSDLTAAGGNPGKLVLFRYNNVPAGWKMVTSRVVNAWANTITIEADQPGLWMLMVSQDAQPSIPAAGGNDLLDPAALLIAASVLLIAAGIVASRKSAKV